MRLRTVAALSLVFTGLFFFEYLPPIHWVDIPYDLSGYHYALDDFAFLSFKSGHFPEWDPTIYCGMSFVGNIQTALFYPPLWLTLLASIGRAHLRYSSLEILVLAHVWLAFLFCFLWLRGKHLLPLASVLGAGVFAYSGYLLLQLQHLGLVCGYAWFPAGLWSIDQAAALRDWRPLWKLAGVSALCFLAGYPPTFVVFCVCMLVYAAFGPVRGKVTLWTIAALAFSLLIGMVQLLPVREALGQKIVSLEYGSGVRRPGFYLAYLIPNYFDFGLQKPVNTNPGGEYLYIGAPALFALPWLILRRRSLPGQLPAVAVGIVCFIFARNPFNLVWSVIRHWDMLVQIVRSWYFLAGITLSAASLTAAGLDRFLRQNSRPVARWLAPAACGLLVLRSARQVWMWIPGGRGFAPGWAGAIDPLVMLALFTASVLVLRAEEGRRRAWLAAALLIAVGIDYKVFGTSKRVNATTFDTDRFMATAQFPGMSDEAFRELRLHPEYRVALDAPDLRAADLRHHGLTTPQGDDPLVPAQYLEGLILPTNPPRPSHWTFFIDPAHEDLLRLLGVRYVVTTQSQPYLARLRGRADYHPVGRTDNYFQVYEFTKALPAYRWDGQVQPIAWQAGRRDFRVTSPSGGQFMLIEQFLPGWLAEVDGKNAPLTLWNHAFQSIQVPAGEHTLSFTYRSRGLRVGAVISLLSLVVLAFIVKLAGRAQIAH